MENVLAVNWSDLSSGVLNPQKRAAQFGSPIVPGNLPPRGSRQLCR